MPLKYRDATSGTDVYVPHLDQKSNLDGSLNSVTGTVTTHASGGGPTAVIELTAAPASGKKLFILDAWWQENSGVGGGGDGNVQVTDYLTIDFYEEDGSAAESDALWRFSFLSGAAALQSMSIRNHYPHGLKLNTADKKLVCKVTTTDNLLAAKNRHLNSMVGVTYLEVD